jgi:hypothetical protein
MSEENVERARESDAPPSARPGGWKMFTEQRNEVTKVVLKPDWQKEAA